MTNTIEGLRAKIIRTQADGLLDIGKAGELICQAIHPSWTRARNCQAGYDFTDENGLKVQVKAWGTDKRTQDFMKPNFDRLVVIEINAETGWTILCDRLINADDLARLKPKYGEITVARRHHSIAPCYAAAYA
jgi:hypothetical protein